MKTLRDMDEVELNDFMKTMAGALEFTARHEGVEKPFFVLLLFNDPEVSQYIANCDRSGCIKALRQCADRLERRETVERVDFPGGRKGG
jgi:hypothetical protein